MSKQDFLPNVNAYETIPANNSDQSYPTAGPATPVIIYVPVITYLLYRCFSVHTLSGWQIVTLIVTGLLSWTLLEYLVHRFALHYEPKSKWGKKLHYAAHGFHHHYPHDSKYIVLPAILSIPLGLVSYILFFILMGAAYAAPFFIGFIVGYIAYDLTHYAVHCFPMKSRYWRVIKKHHLKHHYQEPEQGFGISSPLWDWILRTDFDKKTSEDSSSFK